MDNPEIRHIGRIDYLQAWELQQQIHADRVAGNRPDTVLLLEHPSVYTAGRRTDPRNRPTDGIPVIDVDRGGDITWHGEGQLVAYPIVALANPIDVVRYVRSLEGILIDLCAYFGVNATRVGGRSGAWICDQTERKIGAIGVRVAQGVTMHGFALNCNPDLSAFGMIVPCGLADAGVTSLSAETNRTINIAEVTDLAHERFAYELRTNALFAASEPDSRAAQSYAWLDRTKAAS